MRNSLVAIALLATSGVFAQDSAQSVQSFQFDEATSFATKLSLGNKQPLSNIAVLASEGCQIESITVGKRVLDRVGNEYTDGSAIPADAKLTFNHSKDETCRSIDVAVTSGAMDAQGDDEEGQPGDATGGGDYGDDEDEVIIRRPIPKHNRVANTDHRLDLQDSGQKDIKISQQRANRSRNSYKIDSVDEFDISMRGSAGKSLNGESPLSPHNHTTRSGNFRSMASIVGVGNTKIRVYQDDSYKSNNSVSGRTGTKVRFRSN